MPTPRCPRIDAISWSASPLYGPWCRVPGAPGARRPPRSRVHLHPPMVRWHHGHSPLTVGTLGEVGGPRAFLPRMHLVRYGSCLAPQPAWGHRPDAPPARMADEEHDTASPRWSWARLLKRVFALDMARCSFCQQGTLRIIAAITQGAVIRKILQHLKLSADPPRRPRRVSARKPSPGPQPERRRRLLLRRRLLAARGWGSLAALCPSTPSTSRGCSCAAPLVVAACSTPTRVCTRLSRRPLRALQRYKRFFSPSGLSR